MNLKQLEFAVALAEERHFTRAAERCHVVQSALSHQIARLEEELGAVLFERRPRKVLITPAGEAFLLHAREALDAAQRIRQEVSAVGGEIRGRLHLGMISSLDMFDVVALLARFHQRFSAVDIRLDHANSEALIEAVASRRLDLAFIGVSPATPVEGVDKRLICEEMLVAALPATHPLAGRSELRLEELLDVALVDLPLGSGSRRQAADAFAAAGLTHRVRFEVSHMQLIERFVRQGLAAALVPQSTARGFREVAIIPLREAPQRRVWVIWSATPSPATRELLAELERSLP